MRISRLAVALTLVAGLTAVAGPAHAAPQYCYGKRATKVGTPGPDRLFGSPTRTDVIVGLGGNDFITGGNDYPENGDPPDYICGGGGSDEIYGGPGADHMSGGSGRDTVEGSFGSDILEGRKGADRISDADDEYEGLKDTLRGQKGNDVLISDSGPDTFSGGVGDDRIIDNWCFDPSRLYGGPGSDYFSSYISNPYGGGCSESDADHVFGDAGRDSADVDRYDVTTAVEKISVREVE